MKFDVVALAWGTFKCIKWFGYLAVRGDFLNEIINICYIYVCVWFNIHFLLLTYYIVDMTYVIAMELYERTAVYFLLIFIYVFYFEHFSHLF